MKIHIEGNQYCGWVIDSDAELGKRRSPFVPPIAILLNICFREIPILFLSINKSTGMCYVKFWCELQNLTSLGLKTFEILLNLISVFSVLSILTKRAIRVDNLATNQTILRSQNIHKIYMKNILSPNSDYANM